MGRSSRMFSSEDDQGMGTAPSAVPNDVRIRQGFAARYLQSRSGAEVAMKELWSVKNAFKSRSGGPRRRATTSQRLGYGASSSLEAPVVPSRTERRQRSKELQELAEAAEASVFDTGGRPAKSGKVVINVERQEQLRYIRGAELQDARELEEAPMPDRPEVLPTFTSASHLRSDEYWKSLLGTGNADRSYCSWADSMWFQGIVSVSIIVNALLFGLENGGGERPLAETVVKHVLLAFGFFEQVILVLRVQHGMAFVDPEEQLFCTLDMVAVLGCLLDQWGVRVVLPLFAPDAAASIGPALGTVARVLWLIRFLRVTRVVPSLHELLHGVLQALQGLFWVFVFVMMMLYIIAVLCTAMIGKGALSRFVRGDAISSDEAMAVKEEFSTIGRSMFILFATMSSGSLNPLEPLFEAISFMRVVFCAFFVYAGWTLLAVMTGTVSFTMIAIKAQMANEDEVREQERRQHVVDTLADIFQQLDEDGSGSLDAEEFKMILKSPDVLKLLAANTNIKVQDLEDLWVFLDEDESGEVGVDEFMQGFQWLNEDFKPKTLMRMQEKLAKDIKEKHTRLSNLVKSRFDNIVEQVEAPLCKIHAVTEQVQVLNASLSSLQEDWASPAHMAEGDAVSTQAHLDELEESIEEQLDDIIQRISRFEIVPQEPEGDTGKLNRKGTMLPFFGR